MHAPRPPLVPGAASAAPLLHASASAPQQPPQHHGGALHSDSDASLSSSHSGLSPGTAYTTLSSSSSSNSPASLTRGLPSHFASHLSSNSPLLGSGASPGVGVRRLAEQFLNSLTDDSPAVRPRRIGLGKHTTIVAPSVHVPTQAAELDRFKKNGGGGGNARVSTTTQTAAQKHAAGQAQPAGGKGDKDSSLVDDERKVESDSSPSPVSKSEMKSAQYDLPARAHASLVAVTSSAPSLLHPNTPSVMRAPDDLNQLHADISAFATACAEDAAMQKRLREELVQRTQWSIRCVWPTAQVDLVGSVAAGVPLPKSDLDFVIYFPPSSTPPPSYSYATTPQNQQGQGTATSYTYTTAEEPPVLRPLDGAEQQQQAAEKADGTEKAGEAGAMQVHFAHAGTLIKLIGGRKKSKLLFRSTKIQVFKDINLIRLRDGCSGISMDLWFPVSVAMVTRSQQHTMLIQKMQSDFPNSFYPLSIVLKAFMAQNLLNSGYSGLGSYGVLLMLIRFLQYERFNASKEGREEEKNLGALLIGFFRLYATFDYVHHAIDVVNLGPDGDFVEKPPVLIVKRAKRPTPSKPSSKARALARKSATSDDDDDEAEEMAAQQAMDGDVSGEDEQMEERESNSLRKKRSNAADRFTLLILDPMDSENQIICHHKALRNMIGAFIRALMILDPDNPPPPLMLPPLPGVAGPNEDLSGVPPITPALTATGPGVDASVAHSVTHSAPSSPVLTAHSLNTLPAFPGLTATAHNTNATRFHRLLEVSSARLGPQTKPCTSPQCLNLDGSSKTMCPIQNKVCFTCGFLFKPAGNMKAHGAVQQMVAANMQAGGATSGGHGAAHGAAHGGGMGAGNSHRHSHGHGHRPPMQGQHQRNYHSRAHASQQHQQQQQQQNVQNMGNSPLQNAQMYPSPSVLAAQQLLSAQLSSQSAAAAAVANAASASNSPLLFYNLNTNSVDQYPPALSLSGVSNGMQAAPLFMPILAYTQGYPSAGASMDQQMATMQAMMQQMQVGQAAQAAAMQNAVPQATYAAFAPSAAAAGYPAIYPTATANDLAALYMQPSYVPPLSYDYSPTFPTRTLNDPNQMAMAAAAAAAAAAASQPPSPPTHMRSAANGNGNGRGKGVSSRANHNHNYQAQQNYAQQNGGYSPYMARGPHMQQQQQQQPFAYQS